MRVLLSLAVCIFSLYGSMAQITYSEGYVVTVKGDTVRGNIKLDARKPTQLFQKVYITVSETEKKSFKPEKAIFYSIGDTLSFVSRKLDDGKAFFKVLSSGKLNLYEYQFDWLKPGGDEVIKSEYYLEEEGSDKQVKVKNGKYKKQLGQFMEETNEELDALDDKEFDLEQVVEVIDAFNTSQN